MIRIRSLTPSMNASPIWTVRPSGPSRKSSTACVNTPCPKFSNSSAGQNRSHDRTTQQVPGYFSASGIATSPRSRVSAPPRPSIPENTSVRHASSRNARWNPFPLVSSSNISTGTPARLCRSHCNRSSRQISRCSPPGPVYPCPAKKNTNTSPAPNPAVRRSTSSSSARFPGFVATYVSNPYRANAPDSAPASATEYRKSRNALSSYRSTPTNNATRFIFPRPPASSPPPYHTSLPRPSHHPGKRRREVWGEASPPSRSFRFSPTPFHPHPGLPGTARPIRNLAFEKAAPWGTKVQNPKMHPFFLPLLLPQVPAHGLAVLSRQATGRTPRSPSRTPKKQSRIALRQHAAGKP